MGSWFQQLKEMIESLSLARKISILVLLFLSVSAIGYLATLSGKVAYEPLFTNLNSEDMGSIISRLDKQGTAYRVDQIQRTVLVPATDVLKIRIKMAEEGLPRFGGVGFEIFDKNSFGKSEFEQRVSFQRALEGELTRTILSLREIEKARVHLVLPEKSVFSESQQPARASVILKLGRNGVLPESTVSAISHLVSSAVEGLDPNHITIVDSEGHLLSSGEGDPSLVAGGQALNQKIQIEKSLENRIVELLTPIVGMGKVITQVSADIDFTRSETTEEIFDPTKTAVAQESKTKAKKSEGSAGGENAAAAGVSSNDSEDTEQTRYEVSKTTRRQVSPMGAVKGLSIAILVDGIYEDKNGKMEYAPRPAEDLTRMEELVKSAVGYSTQRGDQIKITNLAFQSPENQLRSEEAWYMKKSTYAFITAVVANVLIVLVIALIFIFVIRPLMASWNGVRQKRLSGPRSAGALDSGQAPMEIGELVKINPEAAAAAIRKWLE